MNSNRPRFFAIERTGTTLFVLPGRPLGSMAGLNMADEQSILMGAIGQPDVRAVIFDFSRLDSFGSLMIGTLCLAWKRVQERGAKLALCNMNEVGRQVLEESKLARLWPTYATRELALESLGSEAAAMEPITLSDSRILEPVGESAPSRLQVLESGPRTVVGFGGADLPPEHALGRYLDEINALIASNGCRELSFDLTGVTSVPSGFLGVMATVLKKGVQISVQHPSREVREVLALTNFDRLVKIVD
jgi:anti-anti-sigma factor